tara:strand:+ start:307 stop:540 length:234 start_codon:yes stop_codon:yes gene_type:complete
LLLNSADIKKRVDFPLSFKAEYVRYKTLFFLKLGSRAISDKPPWLAYWTFGAPSTSTISPDEIVIIFILPGCSVKII